ncbi:MAG: tRNA-dihydrouridine synthase family protein, partial [Kiritimatiellae bacterium]|nr:tRNA-dihydrouridine synthase family protein [Kiritimatiellia bacterium]
ALPLVPQAIGKNPADFATLVSALRDLGYTRCDLNAGCPWPMIVRRGRGAGLLNAPATLFAMLDAGCAALPGGISLKARLGVDDPKTLPGLIDRLNAYPLAALAIHARTARQMYGGPPDLESFAECLGAAKMPVIYNGDIFTPADASRILARFPALAGLMIGRGAARDPTLALQIKSGPPADRDRRLAEFEATYAALNRERLSGPGHFLGRMKEFWSYFKDAVPDGERLWRDIRVARTYDDYDRAASLLKRAASAANKSEATPSPP